MHGTRDNDLNAFWCGFVGQKGLKTRNGRAWVGLHSQYPCVVDILSNLIHKCHESCVFVLHIAYVLLCV